MGSVCEMERWGVCVRGRGRGGSVCERERERWGVCVRGRGRGGECV